MPSCHLEARRKTGQGRRKYTISLQRILQMKHLMVNLVKLYHWISEMRRFSQIPTTSFSIF